MSPRSHSPKPHHLEEHNKQEKIITLEVYYCVSYNIISIINDLKVQSCLKCLVIWLTRHGDIVLAYWCCLKGVAIGKRDGAKQSLAS